jgi:ABC-type polysaccharide/polyol phosphate export permease
MQESRRPRDSTVARLRSLWSELSWLSRVMLVLSVLASATAAVIVGIVLYLFIGGYSGGNSPTSVTPILFPFAILLFVVAGLPSMLICGLLWTGFSLSRRRQARPQGESAVRPRG